MHVWLAIRLERKKADCCHECKTCACIARIWSSHTPRITGYACERHCRFVMNLDTCLPLHGVVQMSCSSSSFQSCMAVAQTQYADQCQIRYRCQKGRIVQPGRVTSRIVVQDLGKVVSENAGHLLLRGKDESGALKELTPEQRAAMGMTARKLNLHVMEVKAILPSPNPQADLFRESWIDTSVRFFDLQTRVRIPQTQMLPAFILCSSAPHLS